MSARRGSGRGDVCAIHGYISPPPVTPLKHHEVELGWKKGVSAPKREAAAYIAGAWRLSPKKKMETGVCERQVVHVAVATGVCERQVVPVAVVTGVCARSSP